MSGGRDGFRVHHDRPEVRKVWPILVTFVLMTVICAGGCIGSVAVAALLTR